MSEPNKKVKRWWPVVDKWCVEFGVSQSLIFAMIEQESGGNENAARYEPAYERAYIKTSSVWLKRCKELGITTKQAASSYGLMQLMFPTAWGYGSGTIGSADDPIAVVLDPNNNIRFGVAHVASLLKKYAKEEMLACFNGGEGGVNALREGRKTQATAYSRKVMSLYDKYRDDALKRQEPPRVPPAPVSTPKKNYFSPDELSCPCCGLNLTKPALLETLNVIREALGSPVIVNSCTRCKVRNALVRGVTNSNHMTGEAADIRCPNINATSVRRKITDMWHAGQLPHLAGVGTYETFTHVDVAPKVAGRLRTWNG